MRRPSDVAKEFKTLDAFAKHLSTLAKDYKKYEAKAANSLGEILHLEAKDKIGHLQDGAGPFKDWKELAESTKADKERLGYVFNHEYNPLYRTGELKDSISHVFNIVTRQLYLGSTDEIMVYQEFGTKYIPPRSVIGLTMYQGAADIKYTMSSMLVSWVSGTPITKMKIRKKTYGSV
jgi:hypothetical protein